MNSNLKLFVWEDVLNDYTPGLVCVLANDLEEALNLIEEKYDWYRKEVGGHPYKVITSPEAFAVYGGG
jgi:hypothetical protein